MLYVSEEYKNIYGVMQYRTLLKTDDFNAADKCMREYMGNNRVTIDSTNTMDTIAVKSAH